MTGDLVIINIFAAATLNFFAAAKNFFEIDIEICKLINSFFIIVLISPILSSNIAVLRLIYISKESVVKMSRFLKNWYYWISRLIFQSILTRMIRTILTACKNTVWMNNIDYSECQYKITILKSADHIFICRFII
jgi:hypothetical protein